MKIRLALALMLPLAAAVPVHASDDYSSWPVLKSTFPSTGGGGITIKGYDPVIMGATCITTFMAVEAGEKPAVYSNVVEFEAMPQLGGILCTNGKWRSFDGSANGTTPFQIYFKNGVFYAKP